MHKNMGKKPVDRKSVPSVQINEIGLLDASSAIIPNDDHFDSLELQNKIPTNSTSHIPNGGFAA